MVPVDEIDVSKLTKVELAVLDGEGLAAAEENRAQVTVGVHGGEVAGLVNVAAELCVDRAGMTVVTLVSEIGNHLTHNVKKVVLKELEVKGIKVVGTLLNHDRAGGVVRNHRNGTVLDTGLLNDLMYVDGDVVEGGNSAAGLQLNFFLNHFEFHGCFVLSVCFKLIYCSTALQRLRRDG